MTKVNKLHGFRTKNKVLKIIGNVFFFGIIGILFSYFMINTIDIRTGYNFPFFGLRDSVIVSNSMSEANPNNTYLNEDMHRINKYDLIITSNYKSYEDIKMYDVITYKSGDDLICHRVVYLFNENGVDYVVTRGDANDVNDEPFAYSEVKGHVVNVIPNVGHVILFLQSGYALLAVFGSLFFFLLAEFIIECTKYSEYKVCKNYKDKYEEDKTFVLNGDLYNEDKKKSNYELVGGDNHYLIEIENERLELYRIIRTDYKKKDSGEIISGVYPYLELEDTILESVVPLAIKYAYKGKDPLKQIQRRLKEMKLCIEEKYQSFDNTIMKTIDNTSIYERNIPLNDKLSKSYNRLLKRVGDENKQMIDNFYHYLSYCLVNNIDPMAIFTCGSLNKKEGYVNA